jgi:hypothetical protein
MLQLLVCSKPIIVLTDIVSLAYILNETDCGNITFNPLVSRVCVGIEACKEVDMVTGYQRTGSWGKTVTLEVLTYT